MNETPKDTTPPLTAKGETPKDGRRAPLWVTILITVLLGMFCLNIAGLTFQSLANFKEEPPRDEPETKVLRVEAFAIEATDLKRYVWGFGTTQADKQVVVSAEVGGRITEIDNLEVGQTIEAPSITIDRAGKSQRSKGEVIVRIDEQTYAERVKQAQSSLQQDAIALERLDTEHDTNKRLIEQQKRRLETIQAEYDRQERLVQTGAGIASTLGRTRLELEQYKETMILLEQRFELYPIQRQELMTRKSAHENDLKLSQLELEKATVYPPFSGLLSEVFVEQGQYVRPGDHLVQITDMDHVEVSVPLSLTDAALVEALLADGKFPNAELAQHEDDFRSENPKKRWRGVVKRIDPIADESTRTVHAFVEIDNSEQAIRLRPGTFVFSRIEAGRVQATRGRLIPRDAIVENSIFLAKPLEADNESDSHPDSTTYQQAVRQPITVIDTFQTFALIEDVVGPNEHVVMTNLDIVREGNLLDVRTVHTLEEEFKRLRVPYLERTESK